MEESPLDFNSQTTDAGVIPNLPPIDSVSPVPSYDATATPATSEAEKIISPEDA